MKLTRLIPGIVPVLVLVLSAAPAAYAQTNTVDSVTSAAVAAALHNDKRLRYEDIDVATSVGVVTLTGAVESRKQSQQAEQLAREINGVKAVNNHLSVITLSSAIDTGK